MELDSVEAAYQLYNLYGFKIGFSIRKAQQYHSAIGEKKLISQRLVKDSFVLMKGTAAASLRVTSRKHYVISKQSNFSFVVTCVVSFILGKHQQV